MYSGNEISVPVNAKACGPPSKRKNSFIEIGPAFNRS